MTRGNRLPRIALLTVMAVLAVGLPADAFPPYRSTDADTADPYTFEARLGLLRLRRERGDDVYSSPLLRLNFGLPHRVELISELEYRPGNEGVADAALGFKWVPLKKRLSFGAETLFLLPVSSAGGTGLEVNLLTTYRDDQSGFRLHLNGGGFYDARPAPNAKGWRASVLAELERGRFRPGLELFARRIGSAPVEVLFGPGVIVSVGRADVRLGLHFGLTAAASDVVADVWVASTLRVR